MSDLIAEAITEAFGERCPDYEPECFCCKAWKQYDDTHSALAGSVVAIDDWLHQYAADMCDEAMVAASAKRISDGGGTLAYIADVQERNHSALRA